MSTTAVVGMTLTNTTRWPTHRKTKTSRLREAPRDRTWTNIGRSVLPRRRRRSTRPLATVWVVERARGHGELAILIQKRLTCLAGDVEADNRLKRERQTSERSDVPVGRKTVRILSVARPDGSPIDEPYGTTKLESVRLSNGKTGLAR